MTSTAVRTDRLQPVRAALLAEADRDADERLRAAEREAAAIGRQAEQAEARLLADARTAGAGDVAAELDRRRTEARRKARLVVLTAQRDAYEQVRADAQAAARRLLDEPANRQRLVAAACRRLGVTADDATAQDHPDGGVVLAARDGRRVDVSVPALVADALAALELTGLWAAQA